MPQPEMRVPRELLEVSDHEAYKRFDSDWRDDRTPRLESVLERTGPRNGSLFFGELLAIELYWLRVRGRVLCNDEYCKRFPQFRDVVSQRFAELPLGPSQVLEIVSGLSVGTVLEFQQHETLVMGRSRRVQLSLPDDLQMSRHHCRLEFSPPKARILDLDSRNGTYINDVRVTQQDLLHGDRIRVGSREMIYRLLAPLPQDNSVDAATLVPSAEVIKVTSSPRRLTEWPIQIAGYEIDCELGRGGLGQVFRARQLPSGRTVAVKVILPAHAVTSEASKLFLREATILSQLNHPRIVKFLELGLSGEQLYLVMEFVPSISFEELCRDMSLKSRWEVACSVIRRVLDALGFAHARHFVHRDVKPANILISKSDTNRVVVKLADFGLAKNYLTAGFSGLTDDGSARGSVAFMPPEQIIDCRTVKPSCDLYATGVTLYKYLTQHLPFETHSPSSVIRAILEERPIRVDAMVPGIPRALADIVERALAKNSADRFRSAEEMQTALMPFIKS